ncbi:MAG: helix-turn-helix domain-containing protein [Actinobacteria bacterium]|nr:helix-turn-helix domain-containing protein [Actinomycetota bacterium]
MIETTDHRGGSQPLLTARELGERLGLSPATVLDWHEAGRLPSFRLGGAKGGPVRFRWEEVEAVLESWRCGPTPRGLEVVR